MTNATQQHETIVWNTETPRSSHWVCFACRKQFQKPSAAVQRRFEGGRPHTVWRGVDREQMAEACPQCGEPLRLIGKNFRAPKQKDAEGWEVTRLLIDASIGHWHSGYGRVPARLRDVPDFLAAHTCRSEGDQLLERWKEQP